MAEVEVEIIRIVDVSYPMFVEFELTDYKGIKHRFLDKVPVICKRDPYEPDPPCLKQHATGRMRCRIVKETDQIYVIDTEFPDDIESFDHEYQFEVWKEQVTRSLLPHAR